MKITELASFGFAALDRMAQTSIQNVVVSLLRLAGIVRLMLACARLPCIAGYWSICSPALLGTVYAIWKGSQVWGRRALICRRCGKTLRKGVFFSIGNSATTVYNDIDKIMLSKLSDLAATGVYAAAYRLIDVSMTPVRSLVSAAYPQFFRKG